MTYIFWKRYSTRKTALKEAAKLRKMGKAARVERVLNMYNWDVLVKLPGTRWPR